jgi:hypothetical protein
MSSIKVGGARAVPFMPDFQPFESLWDGPDAPYPSESSARWAVRALRFELLAAQALAVHRRHLFVHPQKFAQVAERMAIQGAANLLGANASR